MATGPSPSKAPSVRAALQESPERPPGGRCRVWWERMRSPQERRAGRMERLTLRGTGPGLRDRHPQGGTQRGAPPAVPLPPAPRRAAVALRGDTSWEGRTEALLGLTRGLGRRCRRDGLDSLAVAVSARCSRPRTKPAGTRRRTPSGPGRGPAAGGGQGRALCGDFPLQGLGGGRSAHPGPSFSCSPRALSRLLGLWGSYRHGAFWEACLGQGASSWLSPSWPHIPLLTLPGGTTQ